LRAKHLICSSTRTTPVTSSTHHVLLFAGLRDAIGGDRLAVDLPAGATVAMLLAEIARVAPRIADKLAHCRVAVAQEFVGSDRVIGAGEEIALVPPVSGGHDGPARIHLSRAPLVLADVVAAVSHAGAGGIATFIGNVRGTSRGKTIVHLDYESYDGMAVRAMTDIADRIASAIEGARVAIHHRVGRLVVGETAVVIAASAPHRAEAFAACRAAIEALKADVPIWKREVSDDGSEWIGQGP
jgi:molybdopterin converting factor subunit 1